MLDILFILISLAISCSLLGSLLVLKHQAMLVDALSHAILLGIVLGFFISQSLNSPLLILGASFFGLMTVLIIDHLPKQTFNHDAATGLIFTFFFALAVLLISMFARQVQLDIDMILIGEVLFAPFYRTNLLGLSLPITLVKSLAVLLPLLFFFWRYHQALKLYLFDPTQAQLSGINTRILQVMIISWTSLTCVLAFDAIGTTAVISLMVAPSMTALLWARRYQQLLWLSPLIALINVSLGLYLALRLDFTIGGTCAVQSFSFFLLHLLTYQLKKLRLLGFKSLP